MLLTPALSLLLHLGFAGISLPFPPPMCCEATPPRTRHCALPPDQATPHRIRHYVHSLPMCRQATPPRTRHYVHSFPMCCEATPLHSSTCKSHVSISSLLLGHVKSSLFSNPSWCYRRRNLAAGLDWTNSLLGRWDLLAESLLGWCLLGGWDLLAESLLAGACWVDGTCWRRVC